MYRGSTKLRSLAALILVFLIQGFNNVEASGFNTGLDGLALSAAKFRKLNNKNLISKGTTKWQKAYSNKNYAFAEETMLSKEGKEFKLLKLKDLKNNYEQVLFKSALLENVSMVKDVSPDSRFLVFEVVNKIDDAFSAQTYILAFSGKKGFLLSDGISRASAEQTKLANIKFAKNKVELFYAQPGIKDYQKVVINTENNFDIEIAHNDEDDALKAFYGGFIPYGIQTINKTEKEKTIELSLEFDPKLVSQNLTKHTLSYDKETKHITHFKEYGQFARRRRSIDFINSARAYHAEMIDSEGKLLYNRASTGRPMADVISFYDYLYAETRDFYDGKLPEAADIVINGNKVDIDLGDKHLMPLHTLRFAFTFDKFSDYGFYYLQERSYGPNFKNIFIFSNGEDKIKWLKTVYGKTEELQVNKTSSVYQEVLALVEGLEIRTITSEEQPSISLRK